MYSDRKARKFPDYNIVDPYMHLLPKESCPVTNFVKLKAIMLEKDTSKLPEFKEMIAKC